MKSTRNRKAPGSSFLAKKYNLTLDTSSGIDDIKIKQYTLLTERDILSKAETVSYIIKYIVKNRRKQCKR